MTDRVRSTAESLAMLDDVANRTVNELREANRRANAYELGYKALSKQYESLEKANMRNYTRALKWQAGALMTWFVLGLGALAVWLIRGSL